MFATLLTVQKISFGNREYVKASEAAKRFKYTQDYVGQLCRSDKVDARLVGRVWYVNLDSITEYRKTKHATQKNTAKKSANGKTKVKKLSVEPVVRAKTARKLQEVFPREAVRTIRHLSASYSRDKSANIPVLQRDSKQAVSIRQEVERITPNKPKVIIKVRPNTKKSTIFQSEKIPEITLKSKLKVTENVQNLVPESAHDVFETAAHSTVVRSTSVPSKQQKPTSSPINFHPSSVVLKKAAQKATPQSNLHTIAPLVSKNRFFTTLLLGAFLLFTLGAFLLVLGLVHFNETGSPSPSSGLAFSLEIAIEKVQQIIP